MHILLENNHLKRKWNSSPYRGDWQCGSMVSKDFYPALWEELFTPSKRTPYLWAVPHGAAYTLGRLQAASFAFCNGAVVWKENRSLLLIMWVKTTLGWGHAQHSGSVEPGVKADGPGVGTEAERWGPCFSAFPPSRRGLLLQENWLHPGLSSFSGFDS